MIVRPYRKGDEYQINELYNLVFSRNRAINEWGWEYMENPIHESFIYVLEDNNKIIAHFSLLPILLRYEGRAILSGKTENTMMHPEYRGRGLYKIFEKKCIQEAHRRGIILPWVTLSAATKTHIRAGYTPVAPIVNYVKITDYYTLKKTFFNKLNKKIKNKFISETSSLFVSSVFSLLMRKKMKKQSILPQNLSIREITEFDSRFDGFWENNHKYYGITIDRNSRYLNWRFARNPCLSYEVFILETSDYKILGYLILHAKKNVGYIDDIVVDRKRIIYYPIFLC